MSEQPFTLFVPGEMFTINAERRMHHFARAKLVGPFREAAKLITLNTMRSSKIKSFADPVHVEFFPTQAKAGSLADTANHLPPCKAVLDGIVDAGLLTDDTPEWVKSQKFWPPKKGHNPGVGVLIVPEGYDPT